MARVRRIFIAARSRLRRSLVVLVAGLAVSAITCVGGAGAVGNSSRHVRAWGYNAFGGLGDGTTTSSDLPVKVKLPQGTSVTSAAVGGGFSLALVSTGRVLAWGYAGDGELGDGSATGPDTCGTSPCSTTPVKVKLPKDIKAVAVAAGAGHVLALTSTGGVLAWGYNGVGQLGDGTSTGPTTCPGPEACSTTPVRVKLPKGTRATAIAAGGNFSLALTSTGQVLAWGTNSDGELGDGSATGPDTCAFGDPCSTTPVKVKLPKGTRATAIAAGRYHGLARTAMGRVLAWGENDDGQLGDGTFTGPGTCVDGHACSTTPVKVKLPKAVKATKLAAGSSHSLALTSTGQVLAWGYNADGELGDGTASGPETCIVSEPCSTTPVKVKLPKGTKARAVTGGGQEDSLAVTSTGHVLAWGYNGDGELGDGTTTGPGTCPGSEPCSTTPVKVKLPKADMATAVGGGSVGFSSLAIVHRS